VGVTGPSLATTIRPSGMATPSATIQPTGAIRATPGRTAYTAQPIMKPYQQQWGEQVKPPTTWSTKILPSLKGLAQRISTAKIPFISPLVSLMSPQESLFRLLYGRGARRG